MKILITEMAIFQNPDNFLVYSVDKRNQRKPKIYI